MDYQYNRLFPSFQNNKILMDIIKFDYKNMIHSGNATPDDKKVVYGTLHFIRIEASNTKFGYPSLEGPHQDQHEYLAIHMIRKENIALEGAITSLLDLENNPIVSRLSLDEHLDTLYIADEKLKHDVTPFKGTKDNETECYRDILIVDFDKKNKYNGW
jgi:hypothetical protein